MRQASSLGHRNGGTHPLRWKEASHLFLSWGWLLIFQLCFFLSLVNEEESPRRCLLSCSSRFLCYAFKGQHYQCRALMFGLITSLRTFTQAIPAVMANLIHLYLDDVLIQARFFCVSGRPAGRPTDRTNHSIPSTAQLGNKLVQLREGQNILY